MIVESLQCLLYCSIVREARAYARLSDLVAFHVFVKKQINGKRRMTGEEGRGSGEYIFWRPDPVVWRIKISNNVGWVLRRFRCVQIFV